MHVTPRRYILNALSGWWLAAMVLLLAGGVAAQPVATPHVEAELVAETTTLRPGTPFSTALRLEVKEGWHVYWKNHGETGVPTRLRWELPYGFDAGPLRWPYPQRLSTAGIISYAYEEEVFLLTELTPPDDLAAGQTVTLTGQADWLVCKTTCIPEAVTLTLSLPVAGQQPTPDPEWRDAFAQTRADLPQRLPGWTLEATHTDTTVHLSVKPPPGASVPPAALFFPEEEKIIGYQRTSLDAVDGRLEGTFDISEFAQGPATHLRGILVSPMGWNGEQAKALRVDVAVSPEEQRLPASASTQASTIWLTLVLAFAGGVLLNLMPCVFPVLSLKVMGFVQLAGHKRKRTAQHGMAFAAGVLVSFWLLAGLLLALKAGGQELGWGFQLQSPPFVAAMTLLLFGLGLNLLGVFEVGLWLMRKAGEHRPAQGLPGAFFSGVLATVLATPCTAPFMGTALGVALTQPAPQALIIFSALGLGMAGPVVLLSLFPSLIQRLPRSGAWMETFKQALAFPLLASVIWLVWVFGQQVGLDGVLRLLVALLLLGLAGWLLGRLQTMARRPWARRSYRIAIVLVLGAGVLAGFLGAQMPPDTTGAGTGRVDSWGLQWEPFTADQLSAWQAGPRPVFIDFTAAWCLTCKVNERVVFSSETVRSEFRDRRVLLVKADWTSRDPAITQTLRTFGRSGVPFYVLYPGGGQAPVFLPEVLTRQIVMDALEQAPSGTDAAPGAT